MISYQPNGNDKCSMLSVKYKINHCNEFFSRRQREVCPGFYTFGFVGALFC